MENDKNKDNEEEFSNGTTLASVILSSGSLNLQESENKLEELRTREVEANIEMRRNLLDHVLKLTKTINIGVLVLVFFIFITDVANGFLLESPPSRIITENVIMALIGGTVVQIASILLGINRNLFPEGK